MFKAVYGGGSWPPFQKKSQKLRCCKKEFLPQFLIWSLPSRITSSHNLWEEVICVGKLHFENCGRFTFLQHVIFLLTDRILLPSTDFGRPKHGQGWSAANFRHTGDCFPMCNHHLTFYDPSQYLSSFPSNGPKSKEFLYFTDFLVHPQTMLWAQFRCHQPFAKLFWTVKP